MVSLNVTITPFSKEFESCVSGLSLFASSRRTDPNKYTAEHGGKGIQFVSIGKEDLLTDRMYFAVEGTTDACPFVIESEVIYNCDAETTCSGNGSVILMESVVVMKILRRDSGLVVIVTSVILRIQVLTVRQ
ncbi:hypothetical protein GEMRC1_013156 [Eukaryota sp. GEM-RC1]